MSDDEWTNRAALLAADPGLAVRLGGLSPGPELRQRPGGAWVWGRGGHRPLPIAWGPAEISAAQAAELEGAGAGCFERSRSRVK